jgi:hypothetical protein
MLEYKKKRRVPHSSFMIIFYLQIELWQLKGFEGFD